MKLASSLAIGRSESLVSTSTSNTSVALRNLRGFVILIVVAFHSFLAYLGSQSSSPVPFDSPPYHWKAIPITDNERWFGFDLFCASQYVYLMQFMFFLSGLFVWFSLRRKGVGTFIWDRTLRLGVPFLLGTCLLMPVAHYPVYRVGAHDPSWSEFWDQWGALPFWPTGPFWFVWCLLVLNIAAAALFGLAPRAGEYLGRISAGARPGQCFLALLAVSALAYIPFAWLFKPWDWIQFGPFAFQPSFAVLYVVYFFAGIGVGAGPGGIEQGLLASGGILARCWGIWTASAFGAFFTWIIPTALIVEKPAGSALPGLELLASIGFVVASVSACFALVAVFLHFAGTRSPILDDLSNNAYGIYLIHYLFVIWLQYLLLGMPLLAPVKAVIVFVGTLFMSWAIVGAIRITKLRILTTGLVPRNVTLGQSVRSADRATLSDER